ncbi:RNA polymerase sigma factor [Robiginitalea biformata]|nr:RNA polymerase sigma factor [Robiginitalea biformata]
MDIQTTPKEKKAGDIASRPDPWIIEAVLGGDKELFEVLMRRHNELMYRTIRSYLSREEDIEDCMQEAYIKAYRKLRQFNNESQFSTWLIRIGINEALMRIRKGKQMLTVEINQDAEAPQIPDKSIMNPERITMHRESLAYIEHAIDALPRKYKIVYMLKEVEGLEIKEISKSLDLSNSNVKVRLHRARNMMKEYLFKATDTRTVFEFGNARCDRVVEGVLTWMRNESRAL